MASAPVGPHTAVKKTLFTLAPPTPQPLPMPPSSASPTSATIGTPLQPAHATASSFVPQLLPSTTAVVLGGASAAAPRFLVHLQSEEDARRAGITEDEGTFRRLLWELAAHSQQLAEIRRTALPEGGAESAVAQRNWSDAAPPPLKLRREESAGGGAAVVSRRSSSAATAAHASSLPAAAAPHIPLDVARELIAAMKHCSSLNGEIASCGTPQRETGSSNEVRQALAHLASVPVNEAAGSDALVSAANRTLSDFMLRALGHHRRHGESRRDVDTDSAISAQVYFRAWIYSDACDLLVAQRCVLLVLNADEVGDGSTRVAMMWYRCCAPRVRAHLSASLTFHADVIASLLHVGANHRCEATVSRCIRLLAVVSTYVLCSQLQILDVTSVLLFLARVNERLSGLTTKSAATAGSISSNADTVALQVVNQYLQANLRARLP